MSQSAIFLAGEGDAYHLRNAAHNASYRIETDVVAECIERAGLKPTAIIDAGCASGERLGELCRKYNAWGIGVDASREAIDVARDRHPHVTWLHEDWTRDRLGLCDLFITSYVWHWVDRDHLYRAAANIDDSLREGGHIIINDFCPDIPTRNRYHHRKDVEVWTYKQDYALLFLSSAVYEVVVREEYQYQGSGERCACTVLKRLR